MKITRHKRVRRYLNFYKNNFGFRTPFQILIDATFCQEALKCKVNIKEQLPKYLGDTEIKLFTTACVIMEAEALGPKVFGAMLIVKQFKTRKCGHEKNPISAAECLYSMIESGNSDHYILATQDRELTIKVRQLPGVPLIYIKYNAINLEKPSTMNTESVKMEAMEKESLDYQTSVVKKLKTSVFGEQLEAKKKKKKFKGPNPLSCKKKKLKSLPSQNEKVRKRKRHKRTKKSKSIEDVNA